MCLNELQSFLWFLAHPIAFSKAKLKSYDDKTSSCLYHSEQETYQTNAYLQENDDGLNLEAF
jgi:hypothetical protein